MKKRLLSLAAAVCVFAVSLSPIQVKAFDRTDETFVFGVEYTGYLDDNNEEDTYMVVMPTDAVLEITAYEDGINPQDIFIRDENKMKIDGASLEIWNSKKTKQIPLEKGTYYLTVECGATGTYFFTANLIFDSSTDAKVSSPAAGKLKVTAPKGCAVSGFEVRYKQSNESKWTTKKVKGNKALNSTFKDLKSGKTYTVSVRKYIKDSYGYTYYSNWTKNQKVKIK